MATSVLSIFVKYRMNILKKVKKVKMYDYKLFIQNTIII